MKVLHLLKSNKFSGAESIVLTIMDIFPEIEMIYASPEGEIREVVESRGHIFLPLERPSIKAIKNAINRIQPDIIHAHDFSMATKAAWASKNIPVVAHLHNNPLWLKKIHPKTLTFAIALPRIKQVISVSKSIEDEYIFRRLMKNKNIVLGNVVDRENILKKAYKNKNCKPVDLIYIGRMSTAKNPLQFCKIIYEIKKIFPSVSAYMIGDGELMAQVKAYIVEHNLNNTIELLGFKSNPYLYLNVSKLVVMPSIWEGFGLVAVEGMCLGKPIVCSGVGGLADIVDDKCGAKCNSLDEYCKVICELLQNESIYNMYSQNAIHRSKKYTDMQTYKKKIMMSYKKVLNINLG